MTQVNIPFIELKCWKLKVPVGLGRVGEDSQVIKDNKAKQSARDRFLIGLVLTLTLQAH